MNIIKTAALFAAGAIVASPALGQHHDAANGALQPGDPAPWAEPYTLTTCPVSGQPLGSMGEPVVKVYDGREVRFCCSGCIEDFEADTSTFFEKIDEEMAKDQCRFYPVETCVVSGEPLVEDGKDIATEIIVGNRLVRLCCKSCKRDFLDNPGRYFEKLDEQISHAQRAEYPLETCIVSGGELGSMGEPAEMVIATRLVRFCCAMCEPKVLANPHGFLAKLDKAWQSEGKYMLEESPREQKGDHEGHDAHDGHEHGG